MSRKITKYGIWCSVYFGGVAGRSEAWLKNDLVVVEFDTRAEADAEVKRLKERVRYNGTGSFCYRARRRP
jgi:hypothetical protein